MTMLEFCSYRQLKARKEHICTLCNDIIHVGETYVRYSGKYDGQMFDDKHHTTCQNIIQAYCMEEADHEYNDDIIQDWLHDKHCLDCPHYEKDCESFPVSCSLIRQHYKEMEKADEDAKTSL